MSPSRSKNKGKAGDTSSDGRGRKRQETTRAREGRENAAEIAAHHAEKRRAQQERREDRQIDRVEDMLIEREDETEREAQYREFAATMREQNDIMAVRLSRMEADLARQRQGFDANATPDASTSGPSGGAAGTSAGTSTSAVAADRNSATTPASGSIRAPTKLSEVTMGLLREHMGLSDNDNRWFEIRATIRDLMALATLDLDVSWKKQDKTRLGNLYALLLERIPEFERFQNNWPAELMVQDIFNHRRTFRNNKNRTGSPKPKHKPKVKKNPPPPPSSEHSSHSVPPRSPPRETTPGGVRDPPSRAPTPPPPESSPSPSPPPIPPTRVPRKRGSAVRGAVPSRRSERHANAIAAANAAAEDDQAAATREQAKQAAAEEKGSSKAKAKDGRGKKKKATTNDEDENDDDDDGLFPDQPEACEEE